MYIEYNPNPLHKRTGDCVIRAVSKALNQSWEKTFINICIMGLINGDMPSSNYVWGKYLKQNGFKKHIIPDTCPDCYTVERFADDHVKGTYVLATGSHAISVKDGNFYDTWDSSDEAVIYFWEKGE